MMGIFYKLIKSLFDNPVATSTFVEPSVATMFNNITEAGNNNSFIKQQSSCTYYSCRCFYSERLLIAKNYTEA
jgi:hypothetical protein